MTQTQEVNKKKIRLNKFLSECGIASRRKSEELIKEARITINGKVVTDFAYEVNGDTDEVKVDGERVRPEKKEYFLLNKPKGFITSTSDEKGRRTVVSLIKTDKAIFPVGRLDYDTTGILLLTNDGDFANDLTHPRNKIKREYIAGLDKELTKEHRERLVKGIRLDRRQSFFKKVYYPRKNNFKYVGVEVEEGRNHFVKRMFNALGYEVKSLERIRFGDFTINNLPIGHYKKVSYTEIKKMFNS